MDFLISAAQAQTAAPAGASGAPSLMSPLVMMLLFFAVFYFIAIRPQMKRAKEHRTMVSALAKGDEVVAAGGILGRVEEIGESTITVEIAPGTTIKVQKHAIGAVLPKGTLKSA
jgi:preprotein translocase subunit YajC